MLYYSYMGLTGCYITLTWVCVAAIFSNLGLTGWYITFTWV